jgi:hypothetical protein
LPDPVRNFADTRKTHPVKVQKYPV